MADGGKTQDSYVGVFNQVCLVLMSSKGQITTEAFREVQKVYVFVLLDAFL